MSSLPYLLYTAAQTRELDRRAIDEHALSASVLMERAGEAAFSLLCTHWPDVRRIAVFCGGGNNGGDGFVLARLAHENSFDVSVFQVGESSRLTGDALAARQRLLGAGLTTVEFSGQNQLPAELIVDGLLGTGIHGDVSTDYRKAIEVINDRACPVLALDLPSGLNADTGMACGIAVQAACTISFIGLKQGLLTGEAVQYCGELHFSDLNVPKIIYTQQTPAARRLDYARLKKYLQPRPRHAHKGDAGHVLLIGGDHGMAGALRLAGEAALRSGAGLVSLVTRESHAIVINSGRPELMCHGLEQAQDLERLVDRATVIVIGPGLGQGDWGRDMLGYVVACGKPLVLDADALNLMARGVLPEVMLRAGNRVLTPHPGEAARLLGQSVEQIQHDRFSAVRALQEKYAGICVLKGAGTLVADKTGIGVCNAGNPGMASAGMGDVLSGIIGALMAQAIAQGREGPDVCLEAAQLGVCLHAHAADLAVKTVGERGLIASDLMPVIRRLVNPA
ncbi:NAD(P)H-hydrate epimerase / ADP-dependent (S)-NAD(P)H-hydrate dehydratase [hydrothermal vent metagenome]|uniref:Nicotinamide nucleotide repair protein n=1 Tax=hydrothermal vent metagenome TaxID=652676 RepID=A0A3B1BMX6_9ZZZZ